MKYCNCLQAHNSERMIHMKKKSKFILSAVCGFLAALLIVFVRFVDVEPIGPEGTRIGLSHLNQAAFHIFGVNMLWYYITDWLGIVAILAACLFAGMGFLQMIRRRSILKVDREILLLGGLYIVVISLYVLFEAAIVNYRPILMPDSIIPEASFPSSHTMLVCIIMGSTVMLMGKYIKGKTLRKVLQVICSAVIGITIIGRVISGVHWFTDIIGGVLISISLLALYSGILEGIDELGFAERENERSTCCN